MTGLENWMEKIEISKSILLFPSSESLTSIKASFIPLSSNISNLKLHRKAGISKPKVSKIPDKKTDMIYDYPVFRNESSEEESTSIPSSMKKEKKKKSIEFWRLTDLKKTGNRIRLELVEMVANLSFPQILRLRE